MSASTPSRRPHTYPSTSTPSRQSSIVPPNRRVLGELTPNARLSAHSAKDDLGKQSPSIQALKTSSPLKQVHTLSPARGELTQSIVGRKRSIYEVEGLENIGASRRTHGIGTRDAWVNEEKENQVGTAVGVSETPIEPMIEDDLSTTEADTPEPDEITPRAGNTWQEATKVSQSFSSLIDYNPKEAQEIERDDTSIPKSSENITIKERAEVLRLRLRVAMYKVQTDQTNIPLASLQLPSPPPAPRSPRLRRESTSTVSSIVIPSPARHSTTGTASPTRATSGAKGFPPLLPAPVLLPTTYSKRDIVYNHPPSSPPAPSPERDDASYATPTAKHGAAQITEPNSPLGSDARVGLVRREEDENLPSSVVKGRAANGLLELMKAR